MSLVVEKWRELERWLSHNFVEALADLNDGCDEGRLYEVEQKMGVALPNGLKKIYRLHDGQKSAGDSSLGIFYGVGFLPLDRLIEVWELWVATGEQITSDGHIDSLNDGQISFEPSKLKAAYTNNKWIPFGIIAENSYLGLDFDPELDGKEGQVINFGRDEEQKTVLANSFDEFLDWYVAELERGNFVIVEDDGWRAFLPKELSRRILERRSPYLGAVATRFIR